MSQAGILDVQNLNPVIPTSFVTDDGTAVPLFNVLDIVGGTGINTVGGGNTVTINSDGGSITGDDGTISGVDLTVYANNAANQAGSSVLFHKLNATTLELQLSDGGGNVLLGQNAGNLTAFSTNNSTANIGIGNQTLLSLAGAVENTCVGDGCARSITTGGANTSIGAESLSRLTTGGGNIVLGFDSGNNYTSSESDNILIGNLGVAGESHVTRIGTQGSSGLEQNKCFIAGINGATGLGAVNSVVIDTTTGQLGAGAPVGSGVTEIVGDIGSAISGAVNIITDVSGNNCGSTTFFETTGSDCILNVTDSENNTYVGSQAGLIGASGANNSGFGEMSLTRITSGDSNSAFGSNSLPSITSGGQNCGYGVLSGQFLSDGGQNTIIGYTAGQNVVHGNGNLLLGFAAGQDYTASESSNIMLNHTGAAGENAVTRIGTEGIQTKCFAAGINGSATGGTTAPVLIDTSTGQLVAGMSGDGFTTINTISFSASGTYTPSSADVKYIIVETTGGGAGGGGSADSSTGAGGGGGGGAYARATFSAATIGASQAVTIGSGGTAGSVFGGNGGNGGATTFGALLTANGGIGGRGFVSGLLPRISGGGSGGTNAITAGVYTAAGGDGSFALITATFVFSGFGGAAAFGSQALSGGSSGAGVANSQAGQNASGPGNGGSGAVQYLTATPQPGGSGAAGFVYITEYI